MSYYTYRSTDILNIYKKGTNSVPGYNNLVLTAKTADNNTRTGENYYNNNDFNVFKYNNGIPLSRDFLPYYADYTTSQTITIPADCVRVIAFIIGGGGGGGSSMIAANSAQNSYYGAGVSVAIPGWQNEQYHYSITCPSGNAFYYFEIKSAIASNSNGLNGQSWSVDNGTIVRGATSTAFNGYGVSLNNTINSPVNDPSRGNTKNYYLLGNYRPYGIIKPTITTGGNGGNGGSAIWKMVSVAVSNGGTVTINIGNGGSGGSSGTVTALAYTAAYANGINGNAGGNSSVTIRSNTQTTSVTSAGASGGLCGNLNGTNGTNGTSTDTSVNTTTYSLPSGNYGTGGTGSINSNVYVSTPGSNGSSGVCRLFFLYN
jgi:hypothetical protein